MKNVVLTGTGYREDGVAILRADIIRQAETRDFHVQTSVQASTELLVASRTDTTKARKAQEKGIEVISYQEFFRMIGPMLTRKEQDLYWADARPRSPLQA